MQSRRACVQSIRVVAPVLETEGAVIVLPVCPGGRDEPERVEYSCPGASEEGDLPEPGGKEPSTNPDGNSERPRRR